MFLWGGPALVTLLLSLFHSAGAALWRDELASISAATRGLGQLFSLLGNVDASTGFYYLVLHFWTSLFGDSLTALRLPSALAMAVAAALTTQIGVRLYGRAVGVIGGLLFALTPSVSRYGQETRSYAFALMAVALATLLLLRALELQSPGPERDQPRAGSAGLDPLGERRRRMVRRRRWVAYSAALVLVGAFHLVALACLAGHAAGILVHWWRERRRDLLLWFGGAVAAAAAVLTPLAVLGHAQVGSQLFWLDSPNLSTPVHDLRVLWPTLFASYRYAVMMLVLICAAGLLTWRQRRSALLLLAACAVLPVLAVLVISELGTSYFLARYLLFTLPAWCLLGAVGLVGVARQVAVRTSARTPQRIVAAAAVLGLALGAVLSFPDQRELRSYGAHEWTHYPRGTAPDYWAYQAAADTLAKSARSGDGVYYGGWDGYMIGTGVQYYLRSRVRLDQFLATESPEQNGSYKPTICVNRVPCITVAPRRIWLVEPGPITASDKTWATKGQYATAATYHLSRIDVILMTRKG